MIGTNITDPATGKLLEQYSKLTPSSYNPPEIVKKLFQKVQQDYQVAYSLQHRGWDEFDGHSLLQRTRLDQQTFSAYVGLEFLPVHKRWRWKGRKNTARNKIIGILAHLLAGMLFPFVYAQNDEDEEDKMTARVMRILVEEHLRKARYEKKFLYTVLTALVNPKVWVHIEYVTAIQKIKVKLKDGTYTVKEAINEMLTGIHMHVLPIDELLLGDFHTPLELQNTVIRIRRIPYDQAIAENRGKYFQDGKDLTDYIRPGMTKLFLSGNEGATLFDIPWTEADANYVQELTIYYQFEDLELKWVGGVGLFNYKDPYNSNPFKHRRMTMYGKEWLLAPVLPFAGAYFEPLDPTGRFQYGKSAAFKEFWDDATQNKMHQLLVDGTYLDVIKIHFISGIANADSTVMVPGAVVGMPAGAQMSAYSMSPNLAAAYQAIQLQKDDMSESTQDKIMSGSVEKGVTAYATQKAEQNARIFLGEFGVMIADLVRQIGELTKDCVIQHTTIGEIDASVPEALVMRYKTIIAKNKDKGRDMTNRIEFSSDMMGKAFLPEDVEKMEWDLYKKAGGKEETDQAIYKVNPYQFARTKYSFFVDADQIIMRSTGMDKQQKIQKLQMLKDPAVYPFVDAQALANEVIEEWSESDPEKLKKKGDQLGAMMGGVMGQSGVEQLPQLQAAQTMQ